MFVYVWKFQDTPFYVGMSKNKARTDPTLSSGRGWLCKQKLAEFGKENVVVELHRVATFEAGQKLEKELIEKFGRIQTNTGPLTNLRSGGEGRRGFTEEQKQKLRERLKVFNPMMQPEIRAKVIETMRSPEMRARFSGENNPAKKEEARAKIKAKWADPEFRARVLKAREGKGKHTEAFKEAARKRLLDPNHPMRETHKKLNSDPEIAAKRRATMQSAEFKAKCSENSKRYWENKKRLIS
jgi:stalled ribosome alternative rescue factor ArfA